MQPLAKTIGILCLLSVFSSCQTLKILNFVSTEVPDSLCTGKILDGIKWTDKEGSHLVCICRTEKGDFFTPTWRAELTAFKMSVEGNRNKIDWKIRDFTPEIYIDIKYYDSTLKVFDMDNDGIAETNFFYALIPDGAEPRTLKYMLHYKNKKLPIRGTIPVESGDSGYTKNIDSAYFKIPKRIEKYASDYWDNFVKSNFSFFH